MNYRQEPLFTEKIINFVDVKLFQAGMKPLPWNFPHPYDKAGN